MCEKCALELAKEGIWAHWITWPPTCKQVKALLKQVKGRTA